MASGLHGRLLMTAPRFAPLLSFLLACAPEPHPAQRELVFEDVRVLDERGLPVAGERRGALTLEEWQRAARPWTHLEEPFLYHEETWERPLGEGRRERGYRVVRAPNLAPPEERPLPMPPAVAPGLAGEGAVVLLRLAGYPRWDVPLAPPPFFSADERAAGWAARERGFAERRSLFEARAAGVIDAIEALGGRVVGKGWAGGWLLAEVTPAALVVLSTRVDVARITAATGGQTRSLAWSLGELGQPGRIESDRFGLHGRTGEAPNPARHAFGDVTIGVHELGSLEDEACFLRDGPGCTGPSRLRERIQCGGPSPDARCAPVADLPDTDEPGTFTQPFVPCSGDATCTSVNPDWRCATGRCVCTGPRCARHATSVTSIAAADYRGGQADGLHLGDDACPDGCVHSASWKNRASGLAPEASVVFIGYHHNLPSGAEQEDSIAQGIVEAMRHDVDILNNSWVWDAPSTFCDGRAARAFEVEAENAFDDGIFVVAGAGNTPATTGCDVKAPADLPKVFAVNGMPTLVCDASYASCVVNSNSAATGGATVRTPSGEHPGAMRIIAAAAPTAHEFTTVELGEHGEVDDSATVFRFGGSSGAAPVVSGLAALVKDHQLRKGDPWINAPGRLHALMLAMTDRHFDGGPAQLVRGGHADYGFGRVRLRLFGDEGAIGAAGAAGWMAAWSHTAQTNGSVPWAPFGRPLPAATVLAKCVLLQIEDLSDSDVVSDVDLRVEARDPAGGACSPEGALRAAREDTSRDVKSLVALTSADAALGGACLFVVATPVEIAGAAASFQVVCAGSAVADDAALPDGDGDALADIDEEELGTSPLSPDSDGDGLGDGVELVQGLTSPVSADTDGDGLADGVDPILWSGCSARWPPAPRPVAPMSTSLVTGRRPTFRWENAAGVDAARLELCADRACAVPFAVMDVEGEAATPDVDLPRGPIFWRVLGRDGGDVGCAASSTWELFVGGDAARAVATGTVLDVDGDGRADLVAGAPGNARASVHAGGAAAGILLAGPDGAGSDFGARVASAGDVDGDGYGDLAVGAPCAPPDPATNACGGGRVHVYRGGPTGLGSLPAATLQGTSGFGGAVAGAGDLDGDGYGDLLVGAHGQNQAVVFRGGPDGVSAAGGVAVGPPNGKNSFGTAVAGADLDGDGFAELIVGQPNIDSGRGQVHVFAGGPGAPAAAPARSLAGPGGAHGRYGTAVTAGDVDGDGLPDLIVGAPRTGDQAGAVYVHPAGLTVPPWIIAGLAPMARLGHAVDAGDVDGDGYADVVIGALRADDSGGVSLHRGTPAGPAPVASWSLGGTGAGSRFAASVAAIGDLDGDARADVAVGAPGTPGGGAVALFAGSPSGPVTGPTLAGAPGDRLGACVASGGTAQGSP
jgi:hypothetical protein